MGGGGGGSSLPIGELRRLQEDAKKNVAAETGPEKRNVFLSFAFEDLGDVNLLRGQAKNENSELVFNDWSLREPFDSEKAEYIRRGIRERIRQSSVTLVYLSANTANSKWVNWEIRESLSLGKGVVAVHKGDRAPAVLPAAIRENKIQVVPWNQGTISKAIEKAAKPGSKE